MIKTIVELHLPKGLGVNRGGHNPFASCVWVVLALCVPRVVRSIVLESSKSHLPQGDALSQSTWALIPFHSHCGYMFIE